MQPAALVRTDYPGTGLSPGVVTRLRVLKPFAFASGTHRVRFTVPGGGERQETNVDITAYM